MAGKIQFTVNRIAENLAGGGIYPISGILRSITILESLVYKITICDHKAWQPELPAFAALEFCLIGE
jgi:hypothetical protein